MRVTCSAEALSSRPCTYVLDIAQASGQHSAEHTPKKSRPSDEGSDEDWDYLLTSEHHRQTADLYGICLDASDGDATEETIADVDSSALLFQHIPTVLFALHLVYEVSFHIS